MSTLNTHDPKGLRYRVLGEDFMRKVPDRQSVIMVRRSDGERRDAIPSLLMELPDFETGFTPAAKEFIKQSAERAKLWLARRSKKVEPIRPKVKGNFTLRLIVNHKTM